jgi:hypothetical protein
VLGFNEQISGVNGQILGRDHICPPVEAFSKKFVSHRAAQVEPGKGVLLGVVIFTISAG